MQHRPDAPYLFISYASADRERVLALVDAFTRAGIGVWIDRDGIHGGANYGREIAEAIKGAAALVLMASSMSLASRNVKQEIALAWEYERAYLPLLLEPVAIPDDVKYWLTAAQWIEVLDKPEERWLPAVLTALEPLGIAPPVAAREEVHLAGREKELALLREKLVAAQGGTGGLVLIGGEAGIGKTTLAAAVLREAAGQGFAVLEGHCFDLAETPPYGPLIDLFLHLPNAAALPPLPPAFAERGTVGAVPSQMALFAQVEDFLRALAARQPVVILLDDMHWADPASLDLLRYLARSVAGLPLSILVTYRSDELTRRHPLYQLLPQLAREQGAVRIDLGTLDGAAVRAIVDNRYGLPDADAARLVAYLQQRAEGNALFIGELLRAIEEGGVLAREGDGWRLDDIASAAVPALLRQVIDGRVGRLDEESQRLLAIAAVIGYEVPVTVWTLVAESDEDAVLDVIERGLEARLLTEAAGGEAARFAHALIREALYEGIPAIRRRRVHRRIGEVFVASANPDPDTVAFHFHQAGDERALPWLLAAGERAQAAYAWTTAADRYETALSLMSRADSGAGEHGWLHYRLARMRRYADLAGAVAHLDEAARIATTTRDAGLSAAVLYLRGLLRIHAGDIAHGLPEMMDGADALDALAAGARDRLNRHDDTSSGDMRGRRGTIVLYLAAVGRIRQAVAMGEEIAGTLLAGPTGGTGGGALFGDALRGLGIAYATLGRAAEAGAAFARAWAIIVAARHHANLLQMIRFEMEIVSLFLETDRLDRRRWLAEEGDRALERSSGAGFGGADGLEQSLHAAMLEGRWDEARSVAEARRLAPMVVNRQFALDTLAALARARGDRDAAWAYVGEMLPAGADTAPGGLIFVRAVAVQRVAILLALDAGELPTAKEWLEAHDRWLAWSEAVLGRSEGQALWGRYHRQAGDAGKAYEHAERALAHATEPRQPLALLAAHRLLGELDTEAGRYEDAVTHLDDSLTVATACEAPYERALTLLAMAGLGAATGETDTARALLDEVRAKCTPLGAKPTLALADALATRLTIT